MTSAEFEQIFKEYYPRLSAFAAKFLSDDTADDVVQECFLKIWENPHIELRNVSSLLFTMVRNACLNELKHRAIAGSASLDSLMAEEGSEQLYWQDLSPEADIQLIGKELETQINEALSHVSDKSREIFLLSRNEGLKPKEIAERYGITRQAAEKHINAALDALKKHLPKDLLWVAFLYIILLYQ